jgi:CcmD family protein
MSGATNERIGGEMTRTMWKGIGLLLLLALLLPFLFGMAPPQMDSATLGAQSLRSYWHVFVAYAVAWVLVFGWIFSVARRLTRIERRLGG